MHKIVENDPAYTHPWDAMAN